jgi:hypothetical protein
MPHGVSDLIFREFSASRIQYRFNDKNLQKVVSLLNEYPMHLRFSNANKYGNHYKKSTKSLNELSVC